MAITTSVEKNEVERLVAQLASDDAIQRMSARKSLVALRSSDVTAALVAELNDPREHVRWEAAHALVALADPVSAPALVQALEDESVCWLAAEGLVALGSQGVMVVLNALIKGAPSTVLCEGAYHVLRACRDKRTVDIVAPVLFALSRSEPGISAPNAAYKALREIEAASSRPLNQRIPAMAIPHAKSGEVIDIRPLGDRLQETVTATLVKTDALEVLRLVLPAGETINRHQVTGEITVQCLEGRVIFDAGGVDRDLSAGQMLFLEGGTPHALRAVEDSSVLVTILLRHKQAVPKT